MGSEDLNKYRKVFDYTLMICHRLSCNSDGLDLDCVSWNMLNRINLHIFWSIGSFIRLRLQGPNKADDRLEDLNAGT